MEITGGIPEHILEKLEEIMRITMEILNAANNNSLPQRASHQNDQKDGLDRRIKERLHGGICKGTSFAKDVSDLLASKKIVEIIQMDVKYTKLNKEWTW
jgi:hypothetical protein